MPVISFVKRHRLAVAVLAVVVVCGGAWAAESAHTTPHHETFKPFVPAVDAQAAVTAHPTTRRPVPAVAAAIRPHLALHGAVVSPPVLAATAPVAPGSDADFYAQESALERETQLLTLQSKIASLKAKIAQSADGSGSIPPPSVIVAPPASMTPQSGVVSHGTGTSVSIPLGGVPSVTPVLSLSSVLGVDGDYSAVVVDHGVDCTVHEGSVLSDGWQVERIAPSTVVLVRGRHRRILHVTGA